MKNYFQFIFASILFISACKKEKESCAASQYPFTSFYTGQTLSTSYCSNQLEYRQEKTDTLTVVQISEDTISIHDWISSGVLFVKQSETATTEKFATIEQNFSQIECYFIQPDSLAIISITENISPLDLTCDYRIDTLTFFGSK